MPRLTRRSKALGRQLEGRLLAGSRDIHRLINLATRCRPRAPATDGLPFYGVFGLHGICLHPNELSQCE